MAAEMAAGVPRRMSSGGATMVAMPVWSTHRPGDPHSIGHRMLDDGHGRPGLPACGRTTEGLWFRRDHDWSDVPERQRCPQCETVVAVPA